jgi:parallel beta-helix repeat protein
MLQSNFAASNIILTNSNSFLASINPLGPIQLQLNQSQAFIANSSREDIPVTYKWSLESSSIASVSNQTDYLIITHENQVVFKFLSEKLDFCWLRATLNSNNITANATVTIERIASPILKQTNQPTIAPTPTQMQTTSENQEYNQGNHITETISPLLNADLIVRNNAKLQYQVINSTDHSTITDYSSNSADFTLNKAIANGGTIAIMSGNYTGAQLIVPSNANIISSPDVIGIKYVSIGDGARINEPNFNSAFGGYQTGAYTVTTNATDSATTTKCYLAFKPDNSIYYTSTNASYTLNSATNNGGGIFIVGNLSLTTPIILSKTGTNLYSDGYGILVFNGVDGLNITASGVTVYDLAIHQTDRARTKTGITCYGTSSKLVGYETFSNLKLWGWNTALLLKYAISSKVTGIDTTFSYTGLDIWGQSVNNVFSNCHFSNYGTNQTTVLIERDDNLDVSPEGNIISNSLIYGGNLAINLQYAFATQISDSIIDGWTQTGVKILGRQGNSISNNWIGCSNGAGPDSIAVEISSVSANIKGNTLFAYNWSIYIHSSANCLINNNNFIGAAIADVISINNNGGSITNNDLSSSSQTGISLQNSDGFSIYSNTLIGKTTAVNVITSKHNSIVANIINGTQQNGIILDGSGYNSITGNSIYNNGQQSNNSYSDIWLLDGSTYNNVCDNTITALGTNRTSWGILESSSVDDYNVYSGNVLTGQAAGAIGITGSHSLLGTNIPTIG